MPLFVDTSALYALLSGSDERHDEALAILRRLSEQAEQLVATNYVLVETSALVGRRLGVAGVRVLQTDFVPLLNVVWVNEPVHQRAMTALLTAGIRGLSLVDCVSFEIMRQMGIGQAFAFDAHFVQQGFTCLSQES